MPPVTAAVMEPLLVPAQVVFVEVSVTANDDDWEMVAIAVSEHP